MGTFKRMPAASVLAVAAVLVGAGVPAARADIALSSNDGHTTITPDGPVNATDPKPDSVSVIDLMADPPRVTATIAVPGSVVGPPTAIVLTKDEHFAIVTAATQADASKRALTPDDKVSVIDLTATPPQVVQQVKAGKGATTVRLTPDGAVALVANRFEGTVSVLRFQGGRLTPLASVDLGNPKAGPSGIAILPDGRTAIVSCDGDSTVHVLHIDGEHVTLDPRPLTTAMKPYTVDMNPQGTLAAVSNMGRGDGDTDSVSLIDLTRMPLRTVRTVSVGPGPEGLKFSPDGSVLAVATQEGSTKAPNSPFHTAAGRLILYKVAGTELKQIAEAPTGFWPQGAAFSRDGHTILVQLMGDRALAVFHFDGATLTAGPLLPLEAGPAAITTSAP